MWTCSEPFLSLVRLSSRHDSLTHSQWIASATILSGYKPNEGKRPSSIHSTNVYPRLPLPSKAITFLLPCRVERWDRVDQSLNRHSGEKEKEGKRKLLTRIPSPRKIGASRHCGRWAARTFASLFGRSLYLHPQTRIAWAARADEIAMAPSIWSS